MNDKARTTQPGWGKSPVSRKWHYFHDRESGLSLCGTIGFFFGPTEQGNDDSKDNCARCRKELVVMKGATEEKDPKA